MKLHNKSARPHWLGNVMIAPLATEEVGDEWKGAYNANDLEEVRTDEVVVEAEEVEVKPRGRKAKTEQAE